MASIILEIPLCARFLVPQSERFFSARGCPRLFLRHRRSALGFKLHALFALLLDIIACPFPPVHHGRASRDHGNSVSPPILPLHPFQLVRSTVGQTSVVIQTTEKEIDSQEQYKTKAVCCIQPCSSAHSAFHLQVKETSEL